jgi:hypothetical protein
MVSFCFSRPVNIQVRPDRLRAFEKFWASFEPRALRLTMTSDGGSAYGEYTAGSIWKVYVYLTVIVGLSDKDIVLDWGAGVMKVAVGLAYFSGAAGLGIERESKIIRRAEHAVRQSRRVFGACTAVLHFDSSLLCSFIPATIIVVYDGPTDSSADRKHRTIMRTAFETPTVRAIVSTKMCQKRFGAYFPTGFECFWHLYPLGPMMFGKGSYHVYLWVRRRPVDDLKSFQCDGKLSKMWVEAMAHTYCQPQ